jgi:hypothetical protein
VMFKWVLASGWNKKFFNNYCDPIVNSHRISYGINIR